MGDKYKIGDLLISRNPDPDHYTSYIGLVEVKDSQKQTGNEAEEQRSRKLYAIGFGNIFLVADKEYADFEKNSPEFKLFHQDYGMVIVDIPELNKYFTHIEGE